MSERDHYQQLMHDQFEQWKHDLDSYKTSVKDFSADAQAENHKFIKSLEGKLKEGQAKTEHLAESTSEAWESMRDSVESAMVSLKSGFKEAADKMRSH